MDKKGVSTIRSGLDSKKIGANMVFSSISFVLNILISFFVTPYITANIGADAYGFVKLAMDFANYASLVRIALNSMTSRFVMLSRENGRIQEAKSYYTSVTIANIVLAFVMLIPSAFLVFRLEYLLEIPRLLLFEVKLTFVWTLIEFLACMATATFVDSYYLANRLDLNSGVIAMASIVRVVSILVLFVVDIPKISYVALGGLISSLFMVPCNLFFRRRLTPELRFEWRCYDIQKIWEILTAGIWNSITKLSQILTSGIDLLVANTMLGALNMGCLSVAKTIPNMIVSYNAVVGNAFAPNLMKLYARNDRERLKMAVKTSVKFMCLFATIPNAIMITMGKEFYMLWVPEQPADFLQLLSVITMLGSCIIGPTQILYQVFTMTNKVKQSSIVSIIYGSISLGITIMILKFSDLGLSAVAGVSMIGSVVVALGYHIPFSAKYLGLPWHTFYPEILKGVASLGIQCVIGLAVNRFIVLEYSWITWFAGAVLAGGIGLVLNFFLVFRKEERRDAWTMVLSKIKR